MGVAVYETDQSPLLDRLLFEGPTRIADLGAGLGRHTGTMLRRGCRVLSIDLVLTESLRGIALRAPERCRPLQADITRLPVADGSLDAVWASHCLEHMLDPLSVLREWRRVLKPEGVLGVVVPPFKTQVVGRHVYSGWTVGQLMLTLFRAGFDIRHGAYARHLYNVCAIVRRGERPVETSTNDEILCRYHDRFPPAIQAEILRNRRRNTFGETISWFEGEIERLGWSRITRAAHRRGTGASGRRSAREVKPE